MRPLSRLEDFAIRPSIRVSCVLLILGLAYFIVEQALSWLETGEMVYGPKSCSGKGAWICELGNLLASLVPASMREVVEGTSGLVVAGLLMYVAWLLLKPVFRRPKSAR
jgi:hypothetical protein